MCTTRNLGSGDDLLSSPLLVSVTTAPAGGPGSVTMKLHGRRAAPVPGVRGSHASTAPSGPATRYTCAVLMMPSAVFARTSGAIPLLVAADRNPQSTRPFAVCACTVTSPEDRSRLKRAGKSASAPCRARRFTLRSCHTITGSNGVIGTDTAGHPSSNESSGTGSRSPLRVRTWQTVQPTAAMVANGKPNSAPVAPAVAPRIVMAMPDTCRETAPINAGDDEAPHQIDQCVRMCFPDLRVGQSVVLDGSGEVLDDGGTGIIPSQRLLHHPVVGDKLRWCR